MENNYPMCAIKKKNLFRNLLCAKVVFNIKLLNNSLDSVKKTKTNKCSQYKLLVEINYSYILFYKVIF